MAAFKDHFTPVADAYRAFRPRYPRALFRWLGEVAPARGDALDCGCGSGQASLGLAEFFERVHAVDPGEAQIRQALRHPRVTYAVAPAEDTGLPPASVDVAIAAQAMHWFDLDRFWAELRRVARPGAVFAAVTYGLTRVDPEVDAVVDRLYHGLLARDWPPERVHVESGYRTLPFPFPELEAPPLEIEERWPMDAFLGYLGTWSAVTAHRRRTGADPLAEIAPALRAAWGTPERPLRVTWPIAIRAGRILPHAGG
ncbi:class I SAM-dependent methyltransferase [Anaeromyxobacter dehalogenans]|uniref:Methyltransferase type 11 n=2 Tax=Anaeromyxobacter dehalogenans (strain 2CP-C) TaxID=290397 RepID=Q2IE03_ANADE|nr:class I SAM-dependent methyltransferase [Anaeromyxobacter dehalogenans]ABC82811.1 Methyltransferase type 11 [Anaeromyxobacter dehalogenans 2CP-C]